LNKDSLVEGTHREYSLGIFGDFPFGDPTGPRISETKMTFNEAYLAPSDPCTMYGYWQTEKYFRNIAPVIAKRFEFSGTPKALPGDTFIHIRRGDYVNLTAFHGMPGPEYYQKALTYVHNITGRQPTPFIFSDDPEWCKSYFPYPVIEGNTKYEDMHMMSVTPHAIIANSSFSWWGAWLRDPNGITVAPKQWFTEPTVDSSDLIPGRWAAL